MSIVALRGSVLLLCEVWSDFPMRYIHPERRWANPLPSCLFYPSFDSGNTLITVFPLAATTAKRLLISTNLRKTKVRRSSILRCSVFSVRFWILLLFDSRSIVVFRRPTQLIYVDLASSLDWTESNARLPRMIAPLWTFLSLWGYWMRIVHTVLSQTPVVTWRLMKRSTLPKPGRFKSLNRWVLQNYRLH